MNRQKLLAKVKMNREQHIKEHTEAVVGWRAEQERALSSALRHFRKTGEELMDRHNLCDRVIMPKPMSHEADYDQAIALLEMCVEEEFELPVDDFNRWVMDRWSWQHEFNHVKTLYTSGSVKAR